MGKKLARRTFLRGLGGVAMSLPFLDAMRGSVGADPIKRYVQIYTPLGHSPGLWYTPAGSNGFTLTDWAQSLAAHADDMVIVRGMQGWNGAIGHHFGVGAVFTGHANDAGYGLSLDQRVAQLIDHQPIPSLNLGFFTSQSTSNPGNSQTVFRGPNQPLPPTADPRTIFTTLLGDGTASSGEAIGQAHSRRQSVLDLVRDDYQEAEFGLSSNDRTRLRDHAEYIRSIEVGLGELAPTCEGHDVNDFTFALEDEQGAEISRAQLQLGALALACDLTRVVSMQFSRSLSALRYHWLEGRQPGIAARDHHGWTHHTAADWSVGKPFFREIERWHMEQVGFFLDELKRLDVMDGTVTLWGTSEGRGPHGADEEGRQDLTYVLFGDLYGHFATGQVIDTQVNGWKPPEQRQDYAPSLLLAVAQAFGHGEPSFGNSYRCKGGPTPGITA